ncbi:MAG: carbon-nitrogen hydrolase family protein [Desulfobacterales bacterium]|nr:carbon-nitrogen hydrolase family protein [Desulfobacterales bacterium]
MKVTVCQLTNNWIDSEKEIETLHEHLESEKSDLLLLPEMPFSTWLAGQKKADPGAWEKAVEVHNTWLERLSGFNVPAIAGTRPVIKGERRINVGFIWTPEDGLTDVHEKYYLPEEEGWWESSWYHRGNGEFDLITVNGVNIGFLICTEMWFNWHAREYGKKGMHLLLCPRAVGAATTDTWIAGGRAAANVSGAYCLSSNFSGSNTPDIAFGGTGWIIEPEDGNVLGTTSENDPFLTLDIDISAAEKAKTTYPRYVEN